MLYTMRVCSLVSIDFQKSAAIAKPNVNARMCIHFHNFMHSFY